MSEEISPAKAYDQKITSLQRIVEQLRINLYTLEEQAAHYSALDIPLHLRNAISETTARLEHKETEFRTLRSGQLEKLPQNTELKRFWEPFVNEGAKFYIPQATSGHTSDTQVSVLMLTIQALFNMNRLLIEQFVGSLGVSGIRMEIAGVSRSDTKLERLSASSHPHMIVIGAPGANPLSNYLMAQSKGITSNNDAIVRHGYIFRISGDYLGSPFVISDAELGRYSSEEQAAMQRQGIYDLTPDQLPCCFPRTFPQYDVPGPQDGDCAIILTGWASLPGENRIRRTVVVAGHSRHSTALGTTFIATSEEWARQVNLFNYYNTETLIGLQPDPSETVGTPTILASPREIYKQSS
jgi:hypothetical protein